MALDHYVSQVHLKNFYPPPPDGLLRAIRKSDLKRFRCRAQDVCRIEKGSTNVYLKNERAIEEFLLNIEPRYNAALAALRDKKTDREAVQTIAGFAAFISSCAPAAMRVGTGPLKGILETEAAILDREGLIGPAPESFLAGNAFWEVLRNEDARSPFFTSDFPVAIEPRGNSGIVNRIVPLAPDLAVRIIPDVELSGVKADLSFSKFRCRQRKLDHAAISVVNRLIVQCAEDIVFHRDDQEWVARFVAKHRHYRIEARVTRIPHGNGFLMVTNQRIVSVRN